MIEPRLGLPWWHPAALIATGFGLGLLPLMPGSWGSLAALPCAWAIRSLGGTVALAAAAAFAFAIGCWTSEKVARASGQHDPGFIVIDEVAAQWLVLLAAPTAPLPYALAFVLFRTFDIWKPWPVQWADRHVKGGLGIMLDDLFAAVYAMISLLVLLALGGVSGVRS